MNEKKKRLLDGLIKGETISSIAKELGHPRSTLYLWMREEEFMKQRQELETALVEDLYSISLLEVKDAVVTSDNNYYKLQVLQSLMKIKHPEKVEITNKSSLDELLKDL